MQWTSNCAVVIPCYNEGGAIAGVVRAAQHYVPTVIVVADGCADNTREQASLEGARVLHHATNWGKGRALRTGLEAAFNQGFAWALTMDGDGQHAAADIPQFLHCAETTSAALVIGNRMGNAHRLPWLRRFVNRWMSRRLSRLVDRPCPDSQCGFRLINLAVWRSLPIRADHFQVESEMLWAFHRTGASIEFVPVQIVSSSRPSRIHPLLDGARWFRWWFHAWSEKILTPQGLSGVPNPKKSVHE